jgi:phage terminase large subunit-like protein
MSRAPHLRGFLGEVLAAIEGAEMSLEEALALLEPADRTEILELLDIEQSLESPRDFIARLVPREPPPDHTRPLTEFFQRARHGQVREAHSWPPRHGKTVTIMRCLAWWIVNHPADTCAYVTFADRQARSKSRIIRELVERAGVKLAKSSRSLNEWRTEQGGGLLAAGARAGVNGQGIQGVFVYDDPYRTLADAHSPALRETIQETFEGTVLTRLEGGSVLVVHTRWHVDDLIGWLEREKKWPYINIEAIAPDPAQDPGAKPDPLGRKPGTALWASKYPIEICSGPCGHNGHLDDIRQQVGAYVWGALYGGRPPRRGGSVFHDATFYDPETFRLDGHRIGHGVDPAATAKESADWSVILTGGILGQGGLSRLYLLDYFTDQIEVPDLVEKAIPFTNDWPGAPMFVEATGGFKAVPQSIRKVDLIVRQAEHEKAIAKWHEAVAEGRADPKAPPPLPPPRVNVKPVYPTRDKLLRCQAVAAAWNAGRVLVPKGAPWVPGFVARIRAFTGLDGGQDDDADALAHLWNGLWRSLMGTGMSGVMLIEAPHQSYVGADA